MATGQRVGYVRISDASQNTARQLDGIQLDKVFTDKVSGKDTNRPQLQAMLTHVREGDTVLVHSLDRLGRSLSDLQALVAELTAKGVTVVFQTQNLTFAPGDTSPMSTLLFHMLGAVAEFERSLIRERQREGIAIAKTIEGKYKGRKPALDSDKQAELIELVHQGMPKAEIAERLNVSRATVYNALKASLTATA